MWARCVNGLIVPQRARSPHGHTLAPPAEGGLPTRKPRYSRREWSVAHPSKISQSFSNSMQTRSGFRHDINGLRAWAVMAVMLYHFEVPGFRGGFVGVDIFFVISGYLMTGIVSRGLQKHSFDFIEFLTARARRIVPALLTLCAVLMTLGWFTLPPTDYKSLASHAVYSLVFVSNIEYWLSAGYFDTSSHEKWLLHTWSLSVEWQFYLLLPIVLWLGWKAKATIRAQVCLIAGFLLASLIAALLISPIDGSAAFYLIHTRAWELLAGGLLSHAATARIPERWRKHLAVTGLVLLTASITCFSPETLWPSVWTIVPVTGTALVILSNQRLIFTHHPVAQWLGERSYSLYLWHWPVFVVLVTLEWRDQSLAIPAGLMAATALAMASYRFIELPSRTYLTKRSVKINLLQIASATAVVSVMAIVIWKAQGAPSRLPEAAQLIMAEQQKLPARAKECEGHFGVATPLCEYGQSQNKILIVGDSHVHPMLSAAATAIPDATWIPISYVGCPFINGLKTNSHSTLKRHRDYNCEAHNVWVKEQISKYPPNFPVLLVGRYAIQASGLNESGRQQSIPLGYISKPTQQATPESTMELATALTATACELARHRKVFMLRPTPEMPVHVPQTAIRRIMFGVSPEIHTAKQAYLDRNAWVIKAQDDAKLECGAIILDPIPSFCPTERCHALDKGHPIFRDSNHLSDYGSQLLQPALRVIATQTAIATQ